MLKRGKKFNTLFCGLWCYCGTEPADGWKMRILALYNMARGDHATGMCIEDEILKETIDAKEFLVKNGEMFNFQVLSKKNFAVLGHCRQATAMYSKESKEFAHPHSFKKTEDAKRPFLFLVHNGTITNVSDLCHKYNLEHSAYQYSDSIQLGKILTQNWEDKNMEVLKEYEGSATVVFYPISAKNTLYVHRDKIRELYYWMETPNKTYISSVKEALVAIGATEETVVEFEPGMLFKFTNGHITQKWDLTDKKPYSKPFIRTNVNFRNFREHSRPDVNMESTSHTKSKDGYYWENHLFYFNGHLHTGDLFLEKNGRRVLKTLTEKDDKDNYEKIYLIMGVIMRDKENYGQLYNKCCRSDKFRPDIFKNLTFGEIGQHSKYPVLGKSFPGGSDIFWHKDLVPTMGLNDKYEWQPPLSNKKFGINRAGLLMFTAYGSKATENDYAKELSTTEAVKYLIDRKVSAESIYNMPFELFQDYKELKNITVIGNTFDNFLDALVMVIKRYKHVPNTDLASIERSRWSETYGWSDELGDNESFNILIAEALSTTCRQEILAKSKPKLVEDFNDESTDDDSVDTEELLADHFTEEGCWFQTAEFKNQFLFGSFQSFDDAIACWVPTDEKKYLLDLFLGINNLYHDIGVVSMKEWSANKSLGTIPGLSALKTSIRLSYQFLTVEPFYLKLLDSFAGADKDLHDIVGDLYKSIIALENAKIVHSDDTTKLNIYRLALNYIIKKSKNLNKKILLSKYNITTRELDDVCQN